VELQLCVCTSVSIIGRPCTRNIDIAPSALFFFSFSRAVAGAIEPTALAFVSSQRAYMLRGRDKNAWGAKHAEERLWTCRHCQT
jgi:hypothetical protein